MKSFLSTLAFLLVALLVSAGVLEGICRVLYSHKLDYQIEMSRYAATLKRVSPYPGVGHEHIPSRSERLMGVELRTNAHGFRDEELPVGKPDGEYRVMLLGDSLTLGWGVPADRTFAVGLQQRLDARQADCPHPARVRVINTGVGNYNTDQEVSFFEARGRDFAPDLVILAYFINDAEPTPTKRLPSFVKYSYLAMSLWGRIDLFERLYITREDFSNYYPALYEEGQPGWRATRAALGRLAALSGPDDFALVMALLPELHAVGPAYGFAAIHDRVARAAREAGFRTVLDLAPAFSDEPPESLWVSMDDAHPNEKAHAIIADALDEGLAERGIPGCVGTAD